MIKERNILTNLILTIVTFGIYGVVWFITITNDIENASGHSGTSGGMAFLFTLLTCGFYQFFWSYSMGKKMCNIREEHGLNASDNSVLYVILSVLGLNLINYCILQSELNEIAKA